MKNEFKQKAEKVSQNVAAINLLAHEATQILSTGMVAAGTRRLNGEGIRDVSATPWEKCPVLCGRECCHHDSSDGALLAILLLLGEGWHAELLLLLLFLSGRWCLLGR